MNTQKGDFTLEYVPISGPGVDALNNRREHNDYPPITIEKLKSNIDRVKGHNFEALKQLREAAVERASAL